MNGSYFNHEHVAGYELDLPRAFRRPLSCLRLALLAVTTERSVEFSNER